MFSVAVRLWSDPRVKFVACVGAIVGATILSTWDWGGCGDAFPLH